MGKRETERLNRALTSHLSNIHETLQMLDHTPASSLQKVSWAEVIKMGEQVSKNATTAGMVFSGEKVEVKGLEENMETYFNVLQGFLLLAYGSMVGAGPTLSYNINASVKQVVDCSFMLWREYVSSYGLPKTELNRSIPQLVGTVWEACSALKKTPATNVIAIGRAMTQVAVSVKDVLREMKELQPCSSSDPTNEPSAHESDNSNLDDFIDDDDLGKDLSPEEMEIAQLAIGVVSEAVVVVKELIRSITGLLKKENIGNENERVESLEKLLKLCKGVGGQVDELGASLYPPQELTAISKACEEISDLTDEIHKDLDAINALTEDFSQACNTLKNALEMLRLQASDSTAAAAVPQNSSTDNVIPQMQKLVV